MTRFRPVSLFLVTLLCLAVTAPALAYPPYLDPSGIIETVQEYIGNILARFDG